MTKSTQILDVAYGTFSCRLEGFEDSVETMKTVVSYFHDLAGHDRFMDVEPQAPDMETLALLTAEQAGTDIEIAGEGQNVTLRAADDEEDDVDLVAEDDVQDDAEVAEEIENIAVDEADDIDDTPENVFEEDDDDEDDPIVLTDADDDEAFDDDDFGNITEADDYVEDLEEFDDDAPLAAETVETVESDDVDDEEEESIAAKLQRIRAVVGRGHVQAPSAPVESDDGLDSDEEGDDDAPAVNPLAQRLADLAKRNAEFAAQDEEADAESEEPNAAEEFAAADDEDEAIFLEAEVSSEAADEEMDDDSQEDVAHDPLVLTAAPQTDEDAPEEFEEDDAEVDVDSFDLSAELSEVTREIEARDATRPKSADLPDSPETAFTRILNQTDEHLNAPEGRRHRDAFAQLKAAVAATEAARELGDDSPTDAKDNAFREDLGAHDAEEKPATPAPLQLVPSATTDAPTDAAADRLRQIAAKVEENMAPTSGGFAEFAAEQGATELDDLLEAAAAYISFVEGDDDFSRPQVMKKVQSASQEEVSREDGLRQFGRLLRQNKIVKLNNGRFQVAESTRFRPSGT
ncbi:hypothetical protein DS901_13215 [Loktanella sp. D2R18]|uniref:hypothetical protein n=1 Tax=Rhodobacterales TaxID=204455 RepID=UPI000DEB4A4B|nr:MULTISPECIES: hypothetical protein [Rhodobacterales]MDO6591700.1 hypothetical protein [Yoonia sp. 1_MG-2023]RBW42525.1 hypothetical protein DS901_13215 [Loktanella sp. D2R18]